ncbi:MAG: DUF2961 domain-containing protein [Mucilaginibacter polytrichastri]|nr:DUF2961 domain-containing protein [Mucilaginibacter polytrichastri]
MKPFSPAFFCCVLLFSPLFFQHAGAQQNGKPLYEFDADAETRWSSFENPTAGKGAGATENNGAKGHPSQGIAPGETLVLLDAKGPGIINRIWMTVMDRSPGMLRSLRLEMFWDGAKKPAVSAPLGDFFGVGLGRTARFHNAFFADPEGRSFLCFIPMPFRQSARVQITNDSKIRLSHLFYDINFQRRKMTGENSLYFHAFWSRDTATTLGKDFTILPALKGKGRFLGMNMGVNANPAYGKLWWGEGEVKMYVDGDGRYPTLAGTGAEDYIGTGWGQGEFFNAYSGSLIADTKKNEWAFYRYHVPDPVYFSKDIRVTIQQMGSGKKEDVLALQKKGAPMIPATIDDQTKINPLYREGKFIPLDSPGLPDGYAIFYRSDDVSATAYFYLDKPASELPALAPVGLRTAGIRQ